MCRAAGFARVELLYVSGTTACVACFRHWPTATALLHAPAPQINAVVNNADLGMNVRSDEDDYLTWWFSYDGPLTRELTREDLQFEVGGFGCHAVWLAKEEGARWKANTIVPPGLSQGWVEARMRTVESTFSDSRKIAVDLEPMSTGDLAVVSVQDADTWNTRSISSAATHVIIWVRGLGENADRANVAAYWDQRRLPVDFVGDTIENGARQVNACLPDDLPSGVAQISVRYAGLTSNSVIAERL